MGLNTVLLTGDNAAAATEIARQVGITDVRADVRPGQKKSVIEALQKSSAHGNLKSQISNLKSLGKLLRLVHDPQTHRRRLDGGQGVDGS
jgi:hypothetical protein